ncbi:MAG: hypothetical protein CSA75_04130 [Sorangium cellulosum]|nr:MAG: hypothetical protein CSA75_04130 [Sorangium cellulosum]
MRIFGADRMAGWADRWDDDNIPIEHPFIAKQLENAQKTVEGRNFDIRKNLLEYDDVMDAQRKTIYGLRKKILLGEDIKEMVFAATEKVLIALADKHLPRAVMHEDWDVKGMHESLTALNGRQNTLKKASMAKGDQQGVLEDLWVQFERCLEEKAAEFDEVVWAFQKAFPSGSAYDDKTGWNLLEEMAQQVYLNEIDRQWRDHLNAMTALRESVNLRAHAQKDPKQEYKRIGYDMFVDLLISIRSALISHILNIIVEVPKFEQRRAEPAVDVAAEIAPEAVAKPEAVAATAPEKSVESSASNAAPATETPGVKDLLPKSILDAMAREKAIASRVTGGNDEGAQARRRDSGRAADKEPSVLVVERAPTMARKKKRPSRNQPCWCGSGKKYKNCHMKKDKQA